MRILAVMPFSLLGLAVTACGSKGAAVSAERSNASPPPDSIGTAKMGTKLAAFSAKTGAVIIQGFTEIAKLPAIYGGYVAINAKEFTDASSGSKEYGITMQVKDGSSLERENTSYVDYDELESLLKGIDYIGRIDKTITHLANFQADYRTKGDLELTTFSSNSGETLVAVKSGTIGGVQVFYKLSDLVKLRSAIAAALATVDSLRRTAPK
jgi:hypothetical protein